MEIFKIIYRKLDDNKIDDQNQFDMIYYSNLLGINNDIDNKYMECMLQKQIAEAQSKFMTDEEMKIGLNFAYNNPNNMDITKIIYSYLDDNNYLMIGVDKVQ